MNCMHCLNEGWVIAPLDTKDSGLAHWNTCPECNNPENKQPPAEGTLDYRIWRAQFRWGSTDGTERRVHELTSEHIDNIIDHLNDVIVARKAAIQYFQLELERRREKLKEN